MGRLTIEPFLTTEDQAHDEPNPKGGEDRLGRVLAHIFFSVILKTADPLARIIPLVFRFAAIFTGHGACDRFKIFRRFADVVGATFNRAAGRGRVC
jgi:hypothetical protein